jgi:hypothetical protein
VTPTSLGTEGGWVTISADVSDNRSVNYVFANIMLPNETLEEVPLEPVSSSHFVGHYKAPANFGTAKKSYSVNVYGEDDIGQQRAEDAGTFSVAGRPQPAFLRSRKGRQHRQQPQRRSAAESNGGPEAHEHPAGLVARA